MSCYERQHSLRPRRDHIMGNCCIVRLTPKKVAKISSITMSPGMYYYEIYVRWGCKVAKCGFLLQMFIYDVTQSLLIKVFKTA